MSAADLRARERMEIRTEVDISTREAWDVLPPGERAAGHAIEQLGSIARAICNLAETVDARGANIRGAMADPEED